MKLGTLVIAAAGLSVMAGLGSLADRTGAPSSLVGDGPGEAKTTRLAPGGTAETAPRPTWRPHALPAHFVENRGQFDPRVRFAVWKGSTRAWLTESGIVLALRGPVTGAKVAQESGQHPEVIAGTVGLTFESASPAARWSGEEPAAAEFNSFLGNDPANWVTRVPSYRSVRCRGIHPGVDVVLREAAGVLEYDLMLEPGACLDEVVLRVDGALELRLDDKGGLVIETPAGPVVQPRPATFRVDPSGRRDAIACAYEVIDASHVRFGAPAWDGTSRLVIDPSLIFSTFVGGSVNDRGYAIAIDTDGSVIVSGGTESPDFPTTPGAFDTQMGSFTDGILFRLSPDGTALEFATFLGGPGYADSPRELAVDSVGNIVVAGTTGSRLFPTTAGAYDTTVDGPADIFVMKLASDGASLIFSTLIGGPCADSPAGMDLDFRDRVYLGVNAQALGCTIGYPTTPNALCTTPSATGDVNVTRLSSDGSMLEFSTWLCTGGGSFPRDLVCDDLGHAYLLGQTVNSSLPVTAGVFDSTYNGDNDFFIVKVNCDAGAIDWWTYLGGASTELYGDIVVDSNGDIYVAGHTDSANFPSVPGSFDVFKAGDSDGFVVKLKSDGSNLIFGTFLGGTGYDEVHDIALDSQGNAYVAGWTNSLNFPVTPDAFEAIFNGDFDGFLCKVSADGSKLLYGTYFGGSQPATSSFTFAHGVAVGPDNSAAITGYTLASDFPTTPSAFDAQLDGFTDAFVARFALTPWASLGSALAGTGGLVPLLTGEGTLEPGSEGSLGVSAALPSAGCVLVIGLDDLSAPFKGGTMVPDPLLLVPLATDGQGAIELPWLAWPTAIPSGTSLYFQAWVTDAGGPKGYAASQGLKAVTP